MLDAIAAAYRPRQRGAFIAGITLETTRSAAKLAGGSVFGKRALARGVSAGKILFLHPDFFALPGCLRFDMLAHECVSRMAEKLEGARARARTVRFLEEMGGYFDVAGREYVIVTPHPPAPWINYLGTDGVLSGLIAQTGGGTAWFEDSLKNRLLRYNQIGSAENTPGRYLYARDNHSGEIFAPACDPIPENPPDAFECRHGLGYTRIRAVCRRIFFDMVFFVERTAGQPVEIQSVTVTNLSGRKRDLSLFAYREFVNGDVLDEYVRPAIRNYTVNVRAVPEDGTIYNLSGRSMNNRNKPVCFFTSSLRPDGFDTDYKAFFGNGRAHCPDAVKSGRCRDSIGHANTGLGVHQVRLVLPAGARRRAVFIMGVIAQPIGTPRDIAPGGRTVAKVRAIRRYWRARPGRAVDRGLAAIRKHYETMNGVFQCRLPDRARPMELMLNTWNGYGVWLNYLHARSVSDHFSGISRPFLGTRDSASDLIAIAQLNPSAARRRILEWCGTAQMRSGACYHHYNPRTGETDGVTGYSDDQLWISLGVSVYIKETGDFSILDEAAGYADASGLRETVLMHMIRGMRYTMAHLGPHGIPRMLVSDWNHVFAAAYEQNRAGAEGRAGAESVMVGLMLVRMAADLEDMLKAYAARSPAAGRRLRKHLAFVTGSGRRVRDAIERHAWNASGGREGWYAMGSDARGRFFGTPRDREGRVFLIPQAWALFAGVADAARGGMILNAVKKHLYKPESGLVLLTPPYRLPPPLGSFNVYPPGSRENGATFCQAHAMAIPGLAALKDGDFVYEAYRALLPPSAAAQLGVRRYCAPPYGYAQFRFGPDHPLHGQARGSLLTGTAAWSYYGACQWILGVRPDFDGLIIDPCVPRDWPGYTVTRLFRGGLYRITVARSKRASGQGPSIEANGRYYPGAKIPVLGPGSHRVTFRI